MVWYEYRLDIKILRRIKIGMEAKKGVLDVYRNVLEPLAPVTLDYLLQYVRPLVLLGLIQGRALIGPNNPEVYTYLQSEAHKAAWQDPEYRKKASEAMKAAWQDPQRRQKQSEAIKAAWLDPDSKYYIKDYQKKLSEAHKAAWQDPRVRQIHSDAMKAARLDPDSQYHTEESKKRHSEAMKAAWQDPEYRKILSEAKKAAWKDPQRRQKLSKVMKAAWQVMTYASLLSLRDVYECIPVEESIVPEHASYIFDVTGIPNSVFKRSVLKEFNYNLNTHLISA